MGQAYVIGLRKLSYYHCTSVQGDELISDWGTPVPMSNCDLVESKEWDHVDEEYMETTRAGALPWSAVEGCKAQAISNR